ncbi:MAG: hypothetical protein EKK54_01875 [Neisseriaceae bacterium]|nr:MAG: hypothetical protein EKK54_01875 [Neisseriaceae bacterium]
MNSFGKLKKAISPISCALVVLSYTHSAFAVSFEHDYDNPDVIGINLINQTHSVRSYDFTKFFQALAIGQQLPLNVKGSINPSQTIYIQYKVSDQSKTAFCGYWTHDNYAYPNGCLTYNDPYSGDLLLFQTDDTSKYGVSPIIDGVELPLQLSIWDLSPKEIEVWPQNYNILNNKNWTVIKDTSHVNSAKRQDGLSLTISSSSRYGDNYYLDKSEMSWIIKSDRSTPEDFPDGDYFSFCKNISFESGVISATCKHDIYNQNSDDWHTTLNYNADCASGSLVSVRKWGDNNGNGAGTLYCLSPKNVNAVEGAGASKASASINKSAILPWSGNSNSPSVLQKFKVFSSKWLHN